MWIWDNGYFPTFWVQMQISDSLKDNLVVSIKIKYAQVNKDNTYHLASAYYVPSPLKFFEIGNSILILQVRKLKLRCKLPKVICPWKWKNLDLNLDISACKIQALFTILYEFPYHHQIVLFIEG